MNFKESKNYLMRQSNLLKRINNLWKELKTNLMMKIYHLDKYFQ